MLNKYKYKYTQAGSNGCHSNQGVTHSVTYSETGCYVRQT